MAAEGAQKEQGAITGVACTACADDLDTRLLRAMVIKGILEQSTTARVNLVNADLLAKNRGLRIIEQTVPADGKARACLHATWHRVAAGSHHAQR